MKTGKFRIVKNDLNECGIQEERLCQGRRKWSFVVGESQVLGLVEAKQLVEKLNKQHTLNQRRENWTVVEQADIDEAHIHNWVHSPEYSVFENVGVCTICGRRSDDDE